MAGDLELQVPNALTTAFRFEIDNSIVNAGCVLGGRPAAVGFHSVHKRFGAERAVPQSDERRCHGG